MAHSVTLIPGDWIGPETTSVVQTVIAAAGVEIDWEVFTFPDGDLTPEFLDSARRTGRVLMNRMKAPAVAGSLPLSVALRKELQIWSQVRAVRNLPGLPARFSDVDLVVVRETSEDIYMGFEHETTPGVFETVKVTTEAACERIARLAYNTARELGRKKVSIVHKSNIMKLSDGMFLRTAQRVAAEFPDIETEEVIVDALCMRLVRRPSDFDVLLTGNLFGDIVADLAAGLAGGITVGGAVGRGDEILVFDNPHGKAPWLVGTGRANPLPNLMMGIALLESLGEADAADRIYSAVVAAVGEGLCTSDLGGDDGCHQVQTAVLKHL